MTYLLPPFTLPRDNEVKIVVGDALAMLKMVPSNSIHCVVTSPPYWGLRDYGVPGQLGLEATPDEYVANMVRVFQQVRRVLREDGNCFVNIGDSYMKDKRMALIPAKLQIGFDSDGWLVRAVNIWEKTNPLPESPRDRTTRSHEYIIHLSKSPLYWYDKEAISEPIAASSIARLSQDIDNQAGSERAYGNKHNGRMKAVVQKNITIPGQQVYSFHSRRAMGLKDLEYVTRNKRSVWRFSTAHYSGYHYAIFPEELPKLCIKCGCPEGGIVLDPFGGAGTTGLVASRHNRRALLIELNADYAQLARQRIYNDAPLFNLVEVA